MVNAERGSAQIATPWEIFATPRKLLCLPLEEILKTPLSQCIIIIVMKDVKKNYFLQTCP